jgi:hypothetical protein
MTLRMWLRPFRNVLRPKIFRLYEHSLSENIDSVSLGPCHKCIKVDALMRTPASSCYIVATPRKVRVCTQRYISSTHDTLAQGLNTMILRVVSQMNDEMTSS